MIQETKKLDVGTSRLKRHDLQVRHFSRAECVSQKRGCLRPESKTTKEDRARLKTSGGSSR